MSLCSGSRVPLLLTGLLAALPLGARAEAPPASPPAPPLPGPCETPEEIAARVHFERALRAELDGRVREAGDEARATLAATGETGRFAEAARAALARLAQRQQRPASSYGLASRVEFVTTATLLGLYSGALGAAAAETGAQATAGLLMGGTGVGLALSLLGTAGREVPTAWAPMLLTGSLYGTSSVLLSAYLEGGSSNRAGPVLLAEVVGGLAGLGVAQGFGFTGGDAAATGTGAALLGAVPALLAGAASDGRGWAAAGLVGSSVGLVAFPLLNRQLHWSRARWNLIGLGAGVGTLFGGGLLVVGSAKDRPVVLSGLALGTVAGAALAAFLSSGLDGEEGPPGTALLELRPGRGLLPGALLAAVSPYYNPRLGTVDRGLLVRAFEARF